MEDIWVSRVWKLGNLTIRIIYTFLCLGIWIIFNYDFQVSDPQNKNCWITDFFIFS